MTIKAILRDGRIQPVEPIPAAGAEGQELVVEEPSIAAPGEKITEWASDLETATALVPPGRA